MKQTQAEIQTKQSRKFDIPPEQHSTGAHENGVQFDNRRVHLYFLRSTRTPLLPFFFAMLLVLSGCSTKFTHTLDFNPTEPLRVAVMPFAMTDDKGNIIEKIERTNLNAEALIANKKEEPNEIVRKLVQEELSRTALDVVSPALVNANLSHNGLVNQKDLSFDLPKIFNTAAHDLCGRLFSCDAVLYGKVTDWSRSYYAIQSVNTVGIQVKLVSAKSGKTIYEGAITDYESRGITKGPTGFSDLAIAPIQGLGESVILELARSAVYKLFDPLQVKNRPDYMQSSPPGIFASSHDAASGIIARNGYLTVLALGTPKDDAFFSIGKIIENIPMIERSPGHYIGEYHPITADHFDNQPIIVSLVDQFGRTTTQQIGRGTVTLQ